MSKHSHAIKPKTIAKHQIHKKDSGSPEVQVAILTDEIKKLTEHLQTAAKDHSSRRGLLRKVGRRKKILNYLLGEDRGRYIRTCKKNGIRPNVLLISAPVEAVENVEETEVLEEAKALETVAE